MAHVKLSQLSWRRSGDVVRVTNYIALELIPVFDVPSFALYFPVLSIAYLGSSCAISNSLSIEKIAEI